MWVGSEKARVTAQTAQSCTKPVSGQNGTAVVRHGFSVKKSFEGVLHCDVILSRCGSCVGCRVGPMVQSYHTKKECESATILLLHAVRSGHGRFRLSQTFYMRAKEQLQMNSAAANGDDSDCAVSQIHDSTASHAAPPGPQINLACACFEDIRLCAAWLLHDFWKALPSHRPAVVRRSRRLHATPGQPQCQIPALLLCLQGRQASRSR